MLNKNLGSWECCDSMNNMTCLPGGNLNVSDLLIHKIDRQAQNASALCERCSMIKQGEVETWTNEVSARAQPAS